MLSIYTHEYTFFIYPRIYVLYIATYIFSTYTEVCCVGRVEIQIEI